MEVLKIASASKPLWTVMNILMASKREAQVVPMHNQIFFKPQLTDGNMNNHLEVIHIPLPQAVLSGDNIV